MGLRTPTQAKRRRRAAAVAGSALFHLALLGAIATQVPRPEFHAGPEGRTVELSLIHPLSPVPQPPPRAPPPERAQRAPPPAAAASAPRLALPAPPSLDLPSTPAPAPAAPRAAADSLQFYREGVPGCAREDLIVMTPEELADCRLRMAAAAAGERKTIQAGDRNHPAFSTIAPEKRAEYEAALSGRRNRAPESQALMGQLAKERGGAGVNTNIDVSVSARCTTSFSAGVGGLRLGKLNCPNGRPK